MCMKLGPGCTKTKAKSKTSSRTAARTTSTGSAFTGRTPYAKPKVKISFGGR